MIRDISILYIFIVVLCVSCQQKAAHVFIQQEEKNTSKSFETRVEREKRQKEEAEKRQMIELRRKSVTIEEAEMYKNLLLNNFSKETFDSIMIKYVRNGFALFDFYTLFKGMKLFVGGLGINPSQIGNYDDARPGVVTFGCSPTRTSYAADDEVYFIESGTAVMDSEGINVQIKYEIKDPELLKSMKKSGEIPNTIIDYYISNGYSFSFYIDKEKLCDRFIKVLFCYTYFPGKDFDYYWNIQAYGEPIIIKNINLW